MLLLKGLQFVVGKPNTVEPLESAEVARKKSNNALNSSDTLSLSLCNR